MKRKIKKWLWMSGSIGILGFVLLVCVVSVVIELEKHIAATGGASSNRGKGFTFYYFNQGDPMWAYRFGDGDTIANSGCSGTSIAMILRYFSGDMNMNPLTFYTTYNSKYHWAVGASKIQGNINANLSEFNCKVTKAGTTDIQDVDECLANGGLVLWNQVCPDGGGVGHYVVIVEKHGDQYYVADPGFVQKTYKGFMPGGTRAGTNPGGKTWNSWLALEGMKVDNFICYEPIEWKNQGGTADKITHGQTIQLPAGLGTYATREFDLRPDQVSTGMTSPYGFAAGTWQRSVQDAWIKAGAVHDSQGFCTLRGRYLIACTDTYGTGGDKIDFYLNDGTIIKCIMSDAKATAVVPWDPNPANKWGHANGACVLEFLGKDSIGNNPYIVLGFQGKTVVKAVNGGSGL